TRGPMSRHERRLFAHLVSDGRTTVWHGMDWIEDLLPRHPREALAALNAHYIAHRSYMNAGYIQGHFEACTIIRHRYIESRNTAASASSALDTLTALETEWLAGVLYE